MKNGFTFAELMIALTVIAVLAVLLYPTVSELAPNNNKHLFRTAYKTVEMVVEDIISDPTEGKDAAGNTIRTPGQMPTTARATCEEFKRRLNAARDENGNEGCTDAGNGFQRNQNGAGANNPVGDYLTTSNGMRWFFRTTANGVEIYIDVNASNNNRDSGNNAYKQDEEEKDADGNVITPAAIAWKNGSYKGRGTIQDTFRILVRQDGKVQPGAGVAGADVTREHLLNSTKD